MISNIKSLFGRCLLLGIIVFVCSLFAMPMAGKAMAAELELDDQMGGLGSPLTFTLSVNNAPNEVDSLGMDIGYDSAVLEYVGADFTETLLESWSFKQVSNPSPGVLRLGGFTAGSPPPGLITAGASGTLAALTFNVIGDQDCQLAMSALKDDIAAWTTKTGSFTYVEFAIDPSSLTMCEGASAKFTVVPPDIGTAPFTWKVDDEIVQQGDSRTYEQSFMVAETYTISVEDSSVPALTTQATATVLAEDDTGALDIPAGSGADGAVVTIPVRVQNAPNDVSSLGVDIGFDQNVLEYVSADFTGTLMEAWSFKQVSNPEPGVLRLGGFTAGTPPPGLIAAGASGTVVELTFDVACTDCISSFLELQEMKDDIKTWTSSSGCFLACCGCSGDVNGDGEITPLDALCAFEKYLEICPTTCDIPCDQVCCDVTRDGECTPADALCIFNKYLELPSCLD